MSEHIHAATLPPLRPLPRFVAPGDLDLAVPNVTVMPPDIPAYLRDGLSPRERSILRALLAGIGFCGRVPMLRRAELKASENTMQRLWLNGLVGGAGSADARGTGNTAASSWWWLTTKGEAIARQIKAGRRA